MKYRYVTQVMTRQSGLMTIFCDNKEQAETNVSRFRAMTSMGKELIEFDSMSNLANTQLMSEIVSVSAVDMEQQLDIHKHEILNHKNMEKEVDFSQNNNYEDL